MSNTAIIEPLEEYQARAFSTAPSTGINIFDSGAFESIARIAEMMAQSPLVPETLRTVKVNGKLEDLPPEKITANCFLVIEQAARWKISPFAALGCASVIYGRLMWEGKLVAGVLDALLGVKLGYEFTGTGDKMSVVVSGTLPGEDKSRTITGTVAAWKTSQWADGTFEQRMAYRGAREWARRHAPAVLMGVSTEDEAQPPSMRDVTPTRGSLPETAPNPFANLPEPANRPQEASKQQEASPAATTTEETPPPANPEKLPPTGRQQKERHERTGIFKSITEQSGGGKTWWLPTFQIDKKLVTFKTFSASDAEILQTTDKGTVMRITVVETAEKGVFALENFKVEEGGPI